MYLSIKWRIFYNFGANWIQAVFKTCPFLFLRDYYGDSLSLMFPQFPNHFLPFPMVFPYVSPSVCTISSDVATFSPRCFPLFSILDFASKWMIIYRLHDLLRSEHIWKIKVLCYRSSHQRCSVKKICS